MGHDEWRLAERSSDAGVTLATLLTSSSSSNIPPPLRGAGGRPSARAALEVYAIVQMSEERRSGSYGYSASVPPRGYVTRDALWFGLGSLRDGRIDDGEVVVKFCCTEGARWN